MSEEENIRKFVCAQLRGEPDLSTLTIRVIKQRYLVHISSDSMSSETKQLIKEVVKEELVKMQDKEISPDKTVTKTSSKRKREHLGDGDESPSDAEKKSRAKKSRHQSQSSSVLEKQNGKASSDCSENEDKIDETGSERAAEEPDLDSSSLPSLEDEPVNKKEKDKKKKPEVPKTKRKKKRKDSDSSDTATDSSGTEFKPAMKLKPLMKLKRFIALCGVRRNYKQMLGNCKTIDSMIKRLKKELEDLGVEGNPTIEKCKKAREKMERARDAAELDTSNIIAEMDDDSSAEAFAELKTRSLRLSDVAQIAAGTGLAVYAMWVGVLQPGFRRVPLKLQVPYIPASKPQVRNVMTLLEGRKGNIVDLGSGDGRIVLEAHCHGFTPAVGYELNPWLIYLSRFNAWRAGHHRKVSYRREDLWKVDLSECKNVTVFLAPSVLSLLQKKLLEELPDDALVIAGRFPFPDWTPCQMEGLGVDRAWAYSMEVQRKIAKGVDNASFPVEEKSA